MVGTVDLYDHAYGHYGEDVYRLVRVETYGEDLGQTGWTTTEESGEIPRRLRIAAGSYVLEIGCGSGRYALQVAAKTGCRVLGIDINAAGIENANRLAREQHLAAHVEFRHVDAAQPLPFEDCLFDAVFSNDVLCHIPGRPALLRELFRVLKGGARFLFSDALVIGGVITHLEVAARSSIEYYLFSPPAENERLLREAGFQVIDVVDTSANAAAISGRWRAAREKHDAALTAVEGQKNFEGLQQFLATVHMLTCERRLLWMLYVAEKNA